MAAPGEIAGAPGKYRADSGAKRPIRAVEKGGMFAVLNAHDDLVAGGTGDPGRYRYPRDSIARRIA
jgi:hypothetical protein